MRSPLLLLAALAALAALARAQTLTDTGYTPAVRLYSETNYGGWKSETGGVVGCFGVWNPGQSYTLSPNTLAYFYDDYNCQGTSLGQSGSDNANPGFPSEPRSVYLLTV